MKDFRCIMPFVHLGTKPDGAARICCMGDLELKDEHGNRLYLAEHDLETLWNSQYMRSIRSRFRSGERLPECSACWAEEDAGKKSKRLWENEKFAHLAERMDTDVVDDPPVYFDLRLGNLCNLKCRMCNPLFSSEIAQELTENTDWQDHDYFASRTAWELRRVAEKDQNWHAKKYFWDRFESILGQMEEIYVSGGEPSIIGALIDFLDRCAKSGHAERIRIRFNTNMTNSNKRFIKALSNFKEVVVGASIDAVGARNDWIRHPSHFDRVEANLRKFVEHGDPFRVEINATMTMFAALDVGNLFEWRTKNFPDVRIGMSMLYEPEFMRVEYLPGPLKDIVRRECDRASSFARDDDERSLIEVLRSKLDAEGSKRMRTNAIRHAQMLDRWRKQNFLDVFPEFGDHL